MEIMPEWNTPDEVFVKDSEYRNIGCEEMSLLISRRTFIAFLLNTLPQIVKNRFIDMY